MRIAHTFYEVDVIPIVLAIDGTAPPAALSVLSSTNSANLRDFSGALWEDLFFEWVKPYAIVSTTVSVSLEGWISNATAPINTEEVKFRVRACAVGDKGLLSTAMGDWATYSEIFDLGWTQYMRWMTDFTEVTVSGLLATTASQIVLFQVQRDPTDSYAQDIGLGNIRVKYQSNERQS